MKPTLRYLAAAVLAVAAAQASAELLDRPGGMVYDTQSNLTWLVDWNAGAGSPFDDGKSATDGRTTWNAAMAWADALAWYFNAQGGSQNVFPLSAQAHAVAVRVGDVPPVPEPSQAALLLGGPATVVGLLRRRTRAAARALGSTR